MPSLLKTLLLLALGLSVCGAVVVNGNTNAARLARGQPPLRPRVLFDASNVDSAPHAKRSAGATSFDCTGHTITTDHYGVVSTEYAWCCESSAPDTYNNNGFPEGLDAFLCTGGPGTPQYELNTSPACTSGTSAYCCNQAFVNVPSDTTATGLYCGYYTG